MATTSYTGDVSDDEWAVAVPYLTFSFGAQAPGGSHGESAAPVRVLFASCSRAVVAPVRETSAVGQRPRATVTAVWGRHAKPVPWGTAGTRLARGAPRGRQRWW
jgi:hypothetical protein